MAAGFREEPRQAERPLRRQLHRSRAQPITDPLAIHGSPRLRWIQHPFYGVTPIQLRPDTGSQCAYPPGDGP